MSNKAGIICFEVEWQFVDAQHRLGANSEHLIRFLSEQFDIPCIYRRIATQEELEFYMNAIPKYEADFDKYKVIYFSFHGDTHTIHFASDDFMSLDGLADINPDFFRNKCVHFGSCRTMLGSEDVMADFVYKTRAKIVSGYTKKVDSPRCAIHDTALLNEYVSSVQIPNTLDRMYKFYGGLEENLGFITYPKFL